MQEKLEWLFDYSTHVRCEWPHTIEEALCKDPVTGYDVLTEAAKVRIHRHCRAKILTDLCQAHVFDLANWSTAPSLRALVPNADMYVTIWPHSD